jgi:hypothetical protein
MAARPIAKISQKMALANFMLDVLVPQTKTKLQHKQGQTYDGQSKITSPEASFCERKLRGGAVARCEYSGRRESNRSLHRKQN